LTGYASADLRRGWPIGVPLDADVVHLAGLAAVGPSFDSPREYIDGNSAMVTSMCEALLSAGFTGRVVGVSTGPSTPGGRGRPDRDRSVAYTSPPYVVSKVLTENPSPTTRRGLRTVVARPFNHIGPNQGSGFLLPDLLRQHLASTPGRPLRVGNLDTRRDYTDVRDVARAYLALATAPRLAHDVYNVASGTARSGREILEALYEALEHPVPPWRWTTRESGSPTLR
jgi:GDP-4-dehydro-6-deoxy-D-mannose reductase